MAKISVGLCPCCFKERQLATFNFGTIYSTICIYCLKRYIDGCIIPITEKNNKTLDDEIVVQIGSDSFGK